MLLVKFLLITVLLTYSILFYYTKVTGPIAKAAQNHLSVFNVNTGFWHILRFSIRSQSLENIRIGFSSQSSTDHVLTNDFQLIESAATDNNINVFNFFIDLGSLTINETVEIAAFYNEALNSSDQINENVDLKFQYKIINSDNPTNEYILVFKMNVDNDNTLQRNKKK